MLFKREDSGKILTIFGALLVVLAVSFDFFYFAIILSTIYFLYMLYSSRKNFRDDIVMAALLVIYMLFLTFFVILIGLLGRLPQVMGIAGAVFIIAGLYLSYAKR